MQMHMNNAATNSTMHSMNKAATVQMQAVPNIIKLQDCTFIGFVQNNTGPLQFLAETLCIILQRSLRCLQR